MLESNRLIRKRLSALVRRAVLLVPAVCVILLLSQVAFAKNTYVINDGERTIVFSTRSTDPAQILSEAGLGLGADDAYTTQQGVGVSEITVQRSQTVTVNYAGQEQTVTTFGQTVSGLLEELGITLAENESLSVDPQTQTWDGMTVTIDRTTVVEKTYQVTVPRDVIYYYAENLEALETVELIPGRDGQGLNTDSVEYVNGQEVSRTSVNLVITASPVTAVVLTGDPEAPDGSLTDPAVLSALQERMGEAWADGMPYIADGLIITTDGALLFYGDAWQMKATAYTHLDPGCDMITATGTTVHIGTVAVDPRYIPYGTRMFIVSNDGAYIYGESVAEDCGGAIKQYRVDLYFETVQEALNFGVRQVTVYFLQ